MRTGIRAHGPLINPRSSDWILDFTIDWNFLTAGAATIYHALCHYHENPPDRPELGTQAGLERISAFSPGHAAEPAEDE
jgi:hypothetical protein